MRVLSSLVCLHLALGCTYLEIPRGGKNGNDYLLARTMEYAEMPLKVTDWVLVTHPVDEKYLVAENENRQVKIGHVSMDANIPEFIRKFVPHFFNIALDGMNIHGLSISANIMKISKYGKGFPGDYPDRSKVLWYGHLVRWGLSNFKSAKDLVDALKEMHVLSFGMPATLMGLHWAVADRDGNSFVVEYLNGTGKPTIFDNSVRVLTNDPDFRYQTINLDNYVGLTPGEPDANKKIVKQTQFDPPYDQVPYPASNGFNLMGLPGDTTPPSRFVRSFFLREYALLNDPPCGEVCVLTLAQALLNENFIIRGTESEGYILKPFVKFPIAFTQWAVLKIPHTNQMFLRSYVNMQWRLVDLDKLALSSPDTKPTSMPIEDFVFNVVDVTEDLKKSVEVAQEGERKLRQVKPSQREAIEPTIGEGIMGSRLELSCTFDSRCGSSLPSWLLQIRNAVYSNAVNLCTLLVVGSTCWCLGRCSNKAQALE
jgi:choloylglycine hydrolase